MTISKFLTLSTVGLALAACSSEDALQQQTSQQSEQLPISVSTYTENGATSRGLLLNDVDLQKNGFYLYANVNTVGSTAVSPLMAEQKVNYDATKGWTYSPVKYWPTSNDATVDLYALYNVPAIDENTELSYDWNNLPQVIFHVNPEVYKQTDYLWAKPFLAEKRQDHLTDPVKFTFQHALTAYCFRLQTPAGIDYSDKIEKITVNSITLTGYFAPKATIDPRETDINKMWKLQGDWDKRSYTISTTNGGIDPDWYYPKSDTEGNWWGRGGAILRDNGIAGTTKNHPDNSVQYLNTHGTIGKCYNHDYIMLLPYKLAQTYTITMNYTIWSKVDGSTDIVPQTYEVSKDVTTVDFGDSCAGKLVDYTIVLSLNEISVTAEVSNWNKYDGTDTIVNLP